MISGNSKGVNNRHVRFGSVKSSVNGCNGHCAYMASPKEIYCENLIGRKYYVRHLNKKCEIILAGQAILQMSQISRSCVFASMSY